MSRNSKRKTRSVKQSDFFSLFKERDTVSANIYYDPYIGYPPQDIRRKLTYEEHYWSSGDNYFKLARQYYGDRRHWWVIARFNGKPTNSDASIGDRLVIPFPLEVVMDYMEYSDGQT